MTTFVDPLPKTTVALFCQAFAPSPGWSKVTTAHDYTLRVVTGSTGGTISGTQAVSTIFNQISVAATFSSTVSTSDVTALIAPQLPNHTHGPSIAPNGTVSPSGPGSSTSWYWNGDYTVATFPGLTYAGPGTTGPIGPASTGHSHGAAPGTGPGTCNVDFRVKYVDMLLASKN